MGEDTKNAVDLAKDDREADKISQEDFKKIEESENKKSIVKRLKSAFTKKEPNYVAPEEKDSGETQNEKKINDLSMLIDKHSGKLDMLSEFQNSMNDRILDFSASIGELRSIFVSKESFFEKIETQFSEFNEELKEINPKAISENLATKDMKISQIETTLTILKEKQAAFSDELSKYKEIIDKIPNFESVTKSINEIKSREENIIKIKGYIERLTEKTESFFSELSSASNSIKSFESRISDNENSINSLISKLDKIDVKILSKARQDDIDLIKSDLKSIKKELFKQNFKNLVTLISSQKDDQIPRLKEDVSQREESPPLREEVLFNPEIKKNAADTDQEKQEAPKPSAPINNLRELKQSTKSYSKSNESSIASKVETFKQSDLPFGKIDETPIIGPEIKTGSEIKKPSINVQSKPLSAQNSKIQSLVSQEVKSAETPQASKDTRATKEEKMWMNQKKKTRKTHSIKKSTIKKTKTKVIKSGSNKKTKPSEINKKKINKKGSEEKVSIEKKLGLDIKECKKLISGKNLNQAVKLYAKIRNEYYSSELSSDKKGKTYKQIIDLYNLIYKISNKKTNKK